MIREKERGRGSESSLPGRALRPDAAPAEDHSSETGCSAKVKVNSDGMA